ncbi:WD40 repeat domain-containing serine/threonine protein kinase (plasmid) [Tundrisphaera lichenicola]|uniref:WD40 repeat domain-containing serine/threonine protein kinase n=1 Tax=Tundrisphaera lichenicola TaxID=2029860 RepID=UPI003EBCB851
MSGNNVTEGEDSSMNHPDAETDPLIELADEFVGRYRRGERPSLNEYADRYPEHAERIRRLFPALVAMERLDPAEAAEAGVSLNAGAPCTQLGDFRILRQLGRGGMGIVYEAEQVSLGRRVALKVLPRHAFGDAKAMSRFFREARAAARLHHTNIVPIFEVGRQGEDCYYAMQCIHGQGLDQVIAELRRLASRPAGAGAGPQAGATSPGRQGEEAGTLSRVARLLATDSFQPSRDDGPTTQTGSSPDPEMIAGSAVLPGGEPLSGFEKGRRQAYFRCVARIVGQAAGALAHAHARGVVHRDIKPSNILLDTAGVAWLADFGLAKAEEDGLTGTGDLVGTLRYMAPERFRGEGDGRADVYALGLTLYELLTLRPAFDSSDRMELIEAIRDREPLRPRAIDPRVPRELETIALKAIDKDPRQRFQTADELAEDLYRSLNSEPIRARQVRPWVRAALWARRRPAEASLGVVTLLAALVMVGMAVSLWYGDQLQASLYLQKIATAGLAWRDGNFGRLEQLLDTCPEGYRGLWEWRYLKRQCHPERLLLPGHGGGVYHLAYSPDGGRIAAVCFGGTVELWDANSGRRIFSRRAHAGDALGVAFSPDGDRFITTGADGSILLWDVATGRATRLAGLGSRLIWDVEFSLDGDRFATAESGGVVRVLDANTGLGITLPTPPGCGDVFQVAFSPDRRILAFGGTDQPVTLWDLEAEQKLGTLGEPGTHTEGTLGLAFSPVDGRLLVETGTNGLARIWDVAERRLIRDLTGHTGDVYGAAYSPDGGRIATASGDPGVKVWDAADGRELLGLTGHAATVFDVAFRPDGARLATASQDRTVRIWDPTVDPTATVLRGHIGPVNAVAFRPGSGQLASAGDDGTVRLWDEAGRPLHVLSGPGPNDPVIGLAFRPDGGLLATGDKRGAVWVWDLSASPPTGRMLVQLDGEVSSLAFHPDGQLLVTAGADGWVRTWDVRTGVPKDHHPGHLGAARGLAIGVGGRVLATGGEDRTVILRDAATGKELYPPLQGHSCWVYGVAFAPDGRTLSSVGGPDPGASATGRLASVSGDGEVRVWDVATGRAILAILGHGNFVRGVAFLPDGSRIATGGMDRTVKLWDATTGEEVLNLRGHTAGVLGLAFSPDGRRLASAGADGTVRVWDAGR